MFYMPFLYRNNPQFLRIKQGLFLPNFVRLSVQRFKAFAAIPSFSNSILWGYREQDAPNKNNKR